MVQILRSITILAGEKKIILEKHYTSTRIFFSVRAFADQTAWLESKMSFDDPHFLSFYVLDGPAKYFEAKGEGIFQGNVWVGNLSDHDLEFTATEILA